MVSSKDYQSTSVRNGGDWVKVYVGDQWSGSKMPKFSAWSFLNEIGERFQLKERRICMCGRIPQMSKHFVNTSKV